MGHELKHIQFSLPISLVQNLATAIKNRQQDCIVYRGTIPTPEGASSSCIFTAILSHQTGKIKLNIESKSGFIVENKGRDIKCDPRDLKLLRNTNVKSSVGEKGKDEDTVEIYSDMAEEDEDIAGFSEPADSLPKSFSQKTKRKSPAVKNTARKSLRVILEKLDVKTGKIYEVDLSSEEESGGESQSSYDDNESNETQMSSSQKYKEKLKIGGRTRTRVIRKPNKFLEEEPAKPVTPKNIPTRSFPKIGPKVTAKTTTAYKGLQLPPSMSSKSALMQSVQLKPVSKTTASVAPTPVTHPHLFVFGSAQLIEKDGTKQLLLPPMSKQNKPVAHSGAQVLKKPKQVKGPYPTMLIGPGFGKVKTRSQKNLEPEIIESVEADMMEDEDQDPDWQPEGDEPMLATTPRKRKAQEDLESSSSKLTRLASSDKTPIGKKILNESPNIQKGKLADVIKGRPVNQLPKTPLVIIKRNQKNKILWDDHDYLRQRETAQNDGLQTRQKAKKKIMNEVNPAPSDTSCQPDSEMHDDVDDGLNFQKTFMRQLAIPTVYNINQVYTEYLKLKEKRTLKKSAAQDSVPVDIIEVPRIFRQITFTSKGRPIRFQERKKRSEIIAEKTKNKNPDDEDNDDVDDADKTDKAVVVENMDDVLSKTIPSPILDGSQQRDASLSDLEVTNITFDETSVLEPEEVGQLGGCFIPVDENGEEIHFLDEDGEPVDLFDSEGNMRELFTENGDSIKLVDESGNDVQSIYQEPSPDYSNYDPNLIVESMDTVDEYFDENEEEDVSILEIQEDYFEEIPIEESIDPMIKSNQNNLPCEICFNFFLNYRNLLAHLRAKHKKDKHFANFQSRLISKMKVKCEICDAQMSDDVKLMEHMQLIHDVDAEHKCKICSKGFLLHSRLLQHEKKVHRAIDQLCHLCPAVFKNPKSLEKHIEMHTSGEWDKLEEKRICPHCKKKFDKPSTLQTHIKTRHLDPRLPNSTISRCWTCQAEFSTAKELRKHMIAEHVLHGHKYHCTLCKKVFDSMEALTKHKTEVHSGGISLHCPFCGIGYMARHTLISHISNNHLNRETPYKCPFCPSKFIRAVFLQKHIGVVHDLVAEVEVRKGSCDDQTEEKSSAKKCIFDNCEKTFMREKDVVEHILDSHKDHFPHECEICGQRFAKEKYVTSHAHAAHKMKPFLPPTPDTKPAVKTATPIAGRLVQKIQTPRPPLTSTSAVTPKTANITVVSKTPDTPVPKKTILLDSRQLSSIQVQSKQSTTSIGTNTSTSPSRTPIRMLSTTARTLPPSQPKSLLGKTLTIGKTQETMVIPSSIPATRVVHTQQPIQTVQAVQAIEPGQYPDFLVTSPRTQPVLQEQNVDVEHIVYNLNVETNPRAWHYSRIEDHAATLTISQEQTAVATADPNSSINVVSAEELWRIINENIDS